MRLKMEMFPADDISVDQLLDELQSAGYIKRYTVKKDKYIQIVNFNKHQTPHCKEIESTIPAPGKHRTSTVQTPVQHPLYKESGISNKESGISNKKKIKPDFDDWYAIYPKKAAKPYARKCWNRHKPDAEVLIADTLDRIANDDEWIKGFIPNPSTYINQERYSDPVVPPKPADLTESDKYALRQRRTQEIIQEIDGRDVGLDDPALPSPMGQG